jgi:hypothetical protein
MTLPRKPLAQQIASARSRQPQQRLDSQTRVKVISQAFAVQPRKLIQQLLRLGTVTRTAGNTARCRRPAGLEQGHNLRAYKIAVHGGVEIAGVLYPVKLVPLCIATQALTRNAEQWPREPSGPKSD